MMMNPSHPQSPYFVLAHHRSGSNFLNDLLQAHPRIECINEPFSMHTSYFREHDLMPWSGSEFDPELLHPELAAHELLRGFLFDFRAYLSTSKDSRVIGFKDTTLFEKLEWLKAFLPSLKILFLKRDPRAIVSSVLRSNLLDFWDYARFVPPAFKKIYPQYQSRAEAGDKAASAAEIVAMSVVTRYELARRSIQAFEHREVQLDELMRHPREELEAIEVFLGVEPHDDPISFLQQRQVASRGGTFSSFRLQEDVQRSWERHLSQGQLQAIEGVLQCQ